jgi:hypothetical protein
MSSQHFMFRLWADKLQSRVTLSQDYKHFKEFGCLYAQSQQKYGMNITGYRNPGMSKK